MSKVNASKDNSILISVEDVDLDAEEKKAKKDEKMAEEIAGNARTILVKMDQFLKAPRAVQETEGGQKVFAAYEQLREFIFSDNKASRACHRATWKTFLEHEFSREFSARKEAEAHLEQLTIQGILLSDPAGNLEIYWKKYAVPEAACFGQEEVSWLKDLIRQFTQRTWGREKRATENATQALLSQAEISYEELRNGKSGKYAGIVPEVRFEGSQRRLLGGTILVESNGKNIIPLKATGGPLVAVEEMKEMKIFLDVSSLSKTQPPFSIYKGNEIPPEKIKKIRRLWYMLKEAGKKESEDKERREEKESFRQKADLTPEQFFLERKTGTCLINPGPWVTRDKQVIGDLFFLAERRTEKEENIIRIVAVPEPEKDYLSRCMGEYVETGEKFEGLPALLRDILQASHGQLVKTSQIK